MRFAKETELDETLLRQIAAVHSSGLHLLAAPAGAVEAAEIDDEAVARLLTLAPADLRLRDRRHLSRCSTA